MSKRVRQLLHLARKRVTAWGPRQAKRLRRGAARLAKRAHQLLRRYVHVAWLEVPAGGRVLEVSLQLREPRKQNPPASVPLSRGEVREGRQGEIGL